MVRPYTEDAPPPKDNPVYLLDDPAYTYGFMGYYIPRRMNGSIRRFVMEGVVPGDFLQAVIANDLREAVGRADDENMRNLPAYVAFFYNFFPANAWGTYKKMFAWAEKGGLMGKGKKDDSTDS